MRNKIQEIIEKRQIKNLYHFTRAENLESIITNGIMPRDILEHEEFDVSFNDAFRYDGCKNAVCVSVEFPNYKMFYEMRCRDFSVDWVVIELDVAILYELDCAFCKTNAGSAMMYSVPIDERRTTEAFEGMFEYRSGCITRDMLEIPKCYTTNPQAEVLVLEIIPTDYIKGVYFQNKRVCGRYSGILRNDICVDDDMDLFYPRKDYRHWQNIG